MAMCMEPWGKFALSQTLPEKRGKAISSWKWGSCISPYCLLVCCDMRGPRPLTIRPSQLPSTKIMKCWESMSLENTFFVSVSLAITMEAVKYNEDQFLCLAGKTHWKTSHHFPFNNRTLICSSNCSVPSLTLEFPSLSKFSWRQTHSSPYPKQTRWTYRKFHKVEGNFLCVSREYCRWCISPQQFPAQMDLVYAT